MTSKVKRHSRKEGTEERRGREVKNLPDRKIATISEKKPVAYGAAKAYSRHPKKGEITLNTEGREHKGTRRWIRRMMEDTE